MNWTRSGSRRVSRARIRAPESGGRISITGRSKQTDAPAQTRAHRPVVRTISKVLAGFGQLAIVLCMVALVFAPFVAPLAPPGIIVLCLGGALSISLLETLVEALTGEVPWSLRAWAGCYVKHSFELYSELIRRGLVFTSACGEAVSTVAFIVMAFPVLVLGRWMLRKAGILAGAAGPFDFVASCILIALVVFQVAYFTVLRHLARDQSSIPEAVRDLGRRWAERLAGPRNPPPES